MLLTSGAASAAPLVSNMQCDAMHAQNKAGDGMRSRASAWLISANGRHRHELLANREKVGFMRHD
jgi:hypothetical protein